MFKYIRCEANGTIISWGKTGSAADAYLQKASADERIALFDEVEFLDDGKLYVDFNTMLTCRKEGVEGDVPGEGVQVLELIRK